MLSIVDKIGTVLDRSRSTDADPGADPSPGAGTASLLHECVECSEVYLSEGPRRCSTCGTQTAAVESRDWATTSGDVRR